MIPKDEWEAHLNKLVLKNLNRVLRFIDDTMRTREVGVCELAERELDEVAVMLAIRGGARCVSEKEYFFMLDEEGRPLFRKKGAAVEAKRVQKELEVEVCGYA